MSGHKNTSEHFLSSREKSLQKKVVHLETQLQVYKSQIDILHEGRKKLEERVLTVESALTKTKKELLETKKEVLDKELAEVQLSEELKSMTLQAEEYKRLFVAERNKNTCGLDRLEALISNVDAEMHNKYMLNRVESFKDLISVIQEGFQAQIKMILDKLSDVEDKLNGSSSYTEGEVKQTTPVVQFHQTQQSFLQAQANFQHAHPNDTTDGHPLMSKSPLKGARKQDQDCILIYESRTSIANQEAASRLFLPPNFYNYTKREPCPGCIGCRGLPGKSAKFIKQEDEEIKLSPPAPNTKDVIATLSEVALSKGYFQEQMAIRDEAVSLRDETISSMQEEISMLKKQIGLLQSSHYGHSGIAEPSYSSPRDQSKPTYESTPVATKQTPLLISAKPLTHPSIKGPLKIDSNFFAGLASSNSPENRVKEPPERVPSPKSPGRMRHDSSASYTKDIHFEPLIPLPEQIEVQTGEEDETTMFSSRAKLYRYDKDVSAWKERGIGIMKILHNSEKGRSRILMRRESVHKICANHVITADMKLEGKKATANCWIWSTLADFSEEVARAEHLAVKFKTPDEFLLFKEKFEECQEVPKKDAKRQGITAGTYNPTADLAAKFAAKPGSWSCSVCWVPNDVSTTVCVACGALKLPGGSGTSTHQSPLKSGFHLPKESIASSSPQTSMLSSCHENSFSGSPFVFKQKDAGSLSSSPFTFVFSTASSFSTSTAASKPFSFGAPLSADSKKTAAQGDTLTATQVSEVSSGSPFTANPLSTQPFGVPAIDNSTPSPFTFGTVSSTGSAPFSFSETQKL